MTDQIQPARNRVIEIKITGRFPIQSAVGIQNKFETPIAKTDHDIRSASLVKDTCRSAASSTNPVDMPDAYMLPTKTKTQRFASVV